MGTALKHRWSVGHNYLAGITFGDWCRLLRENRWDIDAPYWHRAAFVTFLSLANSWHRRRENRQFAESVRDTPLAGPPLFIVGHWRSGTTHLHNLLAQDERFAFPNTYQVVNPHTFLTTEALNTRLFSWLVPAKRPMDNMALSFQAPQEDEFAPALASLRSPYLGITFPRRLAFYEQFLTFREATEEDRAAWLDAFEWFLRKLTVKYAKPLVLKSPPHTARVALLAERFPGARFVHIHRDPVTVFQSFRHYHDTAAWHTYLQRPDLDALDETLVRRYVAMFEAFFEDVPKLPAGHFHEVAFSGLERDPLGTVAGIYRALDLPEFPSVEPRLAAYLEALSGYEKNRFPPLEENVKARLRVAWGPIYERWGYRID